MFILHCMQSVPEFLLAYIQVQNNYWSKNSYTKVNACNRTDEGRHADINTGGVPCIALHTRIITHKSLQGQPPASPCMNGRYFMINGRYLPYSNIITTKFNALLITHARVVIGQLNKWKENRSLMFVAIRGF